MRLWNGIPPLPSAQNGSWQCWCPELGQGTALQLLPTAPRGPELTQLYLAAPWFGDPKNPGLG